jgi:hypothetical protein
VHRLHLLPRSPNTVLGYLLTPIGVSPAPRGAAIAAWCERNEWRLERIVHDVRDSGQRADRRLGLEYALGEIDAGRAVGLVCERLSDVSDSLPELVARLEWLAGRAAFMFALDYDMKVPAAATSALPEIARHN